MSGTGGNWTLQRRGSPRVLRDQCGIFFNLAGAVHDPDNEGIELANISLAREYAVRAAADYMHDHPEIVGLGDEFRLEVTNKDRLILFTLIVMGVDAPPRDQLPERSGLDEGFTSSHASHNRSIGRISEMGRRPNGRQTAIVGRKRT